MKALEKILQTAFSLSEGEARLEAQSLLRHEQTPKRKKKRRDSEELPNWEWAPARDEVSARQLLDDIFEG